jgi:CBS-domain-containing membrane protein
VYGASGRLFRGTHEQLREIAPVHAIDRPRAIVPSVRDQHDHMPAQAASPQLSEAEAERQRRALAAYARPRPPTGQRWTRIAASAVMSRELLILQDTDPVSRAWRQLDQHRFAQAPVVNAAHVLVGLVTLSGLARLFTRTQFDERGPARGSIAGQPLSTCMLTPVPSVAAEADLRRVAGLLLESALPGLPVVDEDGRVKGFVSRSDILRAVLDDTAIDQWG